MGRDIKGLLNRESFKSEAKFQGDTQLCMADSRQDLRSSVHSGEGGDYLLEEEWMLVGL